MNKTVNKKPISASDAALLDTASEAISSYVLSPTYSPLAFQFERLSDFIIGHKTQIEKIMEIQQRAVEAYAVPILELNERFEQIASMQSAVAERTSVLNKIVANTFANSGLFEVINSFKSVQLEAFAGLTIKAELIESLKTRNNDVVEVLTLTESSFVASGSLKLGIEKNTTAEISTGLIYTSIQTIKADVQALDKNMDKRMLELENKFEASTRQQNKLLFMLENNPFDHFRINKIEFVKKSSQFVINGVIQIKIESMTLQDYVCQALFSGKKNLTDEWDSDELIEELKAIMSYSAEAEKLTWKSIQDIIRKINLKIATKTTKEDLIYSPRSETIQLNPAYFTPSN